MNRSIALLLPLLLAPSGCIIYENNGDQDFSPGGWWNDDGSFDTAEPPEDPSVSVGWTVYPDVAAAGDTLLVELDAVDDRDLLAVTDVSFAAGITVHDLQIDETHILIVIEVDAAATPGTTPITITLANGQVVTVDATFTIDASALPSDTDSGCN